MFHRLQRVASKGLLFFVCIIILLVPSFTRADSQPIYGDILNKSVYDDGSYSLTTIQYDYSYENPNRFAKKGTKTTSYYSSNDILLWKVVLTGYYTYDGTTASCTDASCSVTIYENSWSKKNSVSSYSGNTAYCTAVIVRKILGITVDTRTINMSLTCDPNGVLS